MLQIVGDILWACFSLIYFIVFFILIAWGAICSIGSIFCLISLLRNGAPDAYL